MKKIVLIVCLVLGVFVEADDFTEVTSTEGDKEICAEVSHRLDEIVEYEKSEEKYIHYDDLKPLTRELSGSNKDGSMYAQKCPNWFEKDYDMKNEFASIRFSEIDVNGTKKTLMWTDPSGKSVQGTIALVDKNTCDYKILVQRYNYKRALPPWTEYDLVRIDKMFYLQQINTYKFGKVIYLYILDLNTRILNLGSSKKRCVLGLEKSKVEK